MAPANSAAHVSPQEITGEQATHTSKLAISRSCKRIGNVSGEMQSSGVYWCGVTVLNLHVDVRHSRLIAGSRRERGRVFVRLFDAFVWLNHGAPLISCPIELKAFCFAKFIKEIRPMYIQPTLEGVYRDLRPLDCCLKIIDLDPYAYLRSKNLSTELYESSSALTISTFMPPLDEVPRLWGFFFVFCVRLNVLCHIAHPRRCHEVLAIDPMHFLRTLCPLESRPSLASPSL
ncbi:hypothetical protein K488DRAFT_92027 [Vararia minispora EC-137]|uniref:Uncharacterized protein n=1 Tax=Vararia minispora EC-137 TaxID=1314806 RepID=A0ACB8Q4N5_9AGAM|nr:hypothetical protein K488DRAFT_92027 [Vararia minispora EC-137]